MDIDCQDTQLRSPLLLAASKGGWKSVSLLLDRGADMSLKDCKARNFLHLAIKYGCRLDNFGVDLVQVTCLCCRSKIKEKTQCQNHKARTLFFEMHF